jgi:hypothetical protein
MNCRGDREAQSPVAKQLGQSPRIPIHQQSSSDLFDYEHIQDNSIDNICQQLFEQGEFHSLSHLMRVNKRAHKVCQGYLNQIKPHGDVIKYMVNAIKKLQKKSITLVFPLHETVILDHPPNVSKLLEKFNQCLMAVTQYVKECLNRDPIESVNSISLEPIPWSFMIFDGIFLPYQLKLFTNLSIKDAEDTGEDSIIFPKIRHFLRCLKVIDPYVVYRPDEGIPLTDEKGHAILDFEINIGPTIEW